MPLYIEQSGDLVGCHRCLTDRQTDFERKSYSAPEKWSSRDAIPFPPPSLFVWIVQD